MYEQFKELADVDITTGPMEVGPTTHYVMGGIKVDAEDGATRVPGLFGAGEVAGGMHGANRPGGNCIQICSLFGARPVRAGGPRRAVEGEPHMDPVMVRTALRELRSPSDPEAGSVRRDARPAGRHAAAGGSSR